MTELGAPTAIELQYERTIGIVNNGFSGRGFASPYDLAVSSDELIFVLNRCDFARLDAIRIGILNLEEDYLGEFGKGFGDGDDQFGLPTGMTFDSRDRLHVTDERLHRVTVFDTSGNFLSKWGGFGSGDGEVAVDGHGLDLSSSGLNSRRLGIGLRRIHLLDLDSVTMLPWEYLFAPWGISSPVERPGSGLKPFLQLTKSA